jgi:hypothetical protein
MAPVTRPRRTNRITHSTSTTGGAGIPPAAPVDPRLIFQARVDIRNDVLWQERPTVRTTLQRLLMIFENSGELSADELTKIHNIVRYNDSQRRRDKYDPNADLGPLPEAVVTPFATPAEDLEEEEVAGASLPEQAVTYFDPLLPAAYIAEGLGFATPSIVNTWQRKHPDWPTPITREGRKTRLYRLGDIERWINKHEAEVNDARRTGGTRHATALSKDAEIAELRAEIERLKAGGTIQ